MVTVVGRGGIGKTAMVCRLLKLFEAGRIPDVDGDLGDFTVGGIVYLSRNGLHRVEYSTLVGDLLHLVSADAVRRLQSLYEDPQYAAAQVMRTVLEAFPLGEPVVVVLDNVESVMDTEHETLTEEALEEALRVVLTTPAHAVTVIIATRVKPTALLMVEPAGQRQLRLDKGLGSPDAENVLRDLDEDGQLGLRDAPMRCSTHYAATPAATRGRWRRSRQSWMVTTRSPRKSSSTGPGSCPETGSWRCWLGRPTSCWTLQRNR
jgi:hypothetical protein